MEWDNKIIEKGKKILETINFVNVGPNKENVLNFLNMPFARIKVVILGQDPYPTPGVANGRAFAVNKNSKIPQSLKNIFKEIKEVQGNVFTDQTLDSWEQQGVLLLNTSLTVEFYKPNSHKSIWNNYINKVIKFIDKNSQCIWVLWGKEAQKFDKILSNTIIKDAHPSPLSVRHRTKITFKKLPFIKW